MIAEIARIASEPEREKIGVAMNLHKLSRTRLIARRERRRE